jgi:DNA-binding FadR family transcriptional regulator
MPPACRFFARWWWDVKTFSKGRESQPPDVAAPNQTATWMPPADRPARLAPVVTEQLLRRIARGDFSAGSYMLSELRLAAEFKVSRTVIRESVRALEQKGVLSAQQGRGTVVSDRSQWSAFDPLVISVRLDTEPTTELFRDLADIRLAVECQLSNSAAMNASAAMLGEMTRVVEEQRQIPISEPRYTDLDIEFHHLIAEASGNQIGQGIMLTLAPALRAMRRLTNEIPDATAHTREWHGRILDRIRARDPEGASAAMRKHLGWSREHFLSLKTD